MPLDDSTVVAKKPRVHLLCLDSKSAAGPSSNTSFVDALMAVPDLALACVKALESDMHAQGPGSGLKRLRLLSQGVKVAVHKSVQGYTCKLGSSEAFASAINNPKLLDFLKGSRLLRLSITVPSLGTATDKSSIKAAAMKLKKQLRTFIAGVGQALISVNHLQLFFPPVIDTREGQKTASAHNNYILLQLAAVCPHLKRLAVTGYIGTSLFEQFGFKCPKLASLEAVLGDMRTKRLLTLPALFPDLNSFTALTPPSNVMLNHQSPVAQKALTKVAHARIVTVLQACPGLLAVDIGSSAMTGTIWAALPKGLTCLSYSNFHPRKKQGTMVHTSLRSLAMRASVINLTQLVALLKVAPNVSILCMREHAEVTSVLTRESVCDLKYLDSRLQAGLVVNRFEDATNLDDSSKGHALHLVFNVSPYTRSAGQDETTETFKHPVFAFMTASIMDTPLLSFTNITFDVDELYEGESGNFSNIPRVFPNVQDLTVTNLEMDDVGALSDCTSLQTLTLTDVDGVSRSEIEDLCKASKSLRNVHLEGCRGFSREDGDWIARTGAKLSGVSVVVARGDRLEEEDDMEEEREMEDNGFDGPCGDSDDESDEDEDDYSD